MFQRDKSCFSLDQAAGTFTVEGIAVLTRNAFGVFNLFLANGQLKSKWGMEWGWRRWFLTVAGSTRGAPEKSPAELRL